MSKNMKSDRSISSFVSLGQTSEQQQINQNVHNADLFPAQEHEHSAFMCDEEMDVKEIPSPTQKKVKPMVKKKPPGSMKKQPTFSLYQQDNYKQAKNIHKHTTSPNTLPSKLLQKEPAGFRNDIKSSITNQNPKYITSEPKNLTKTIEVINLTDDQTQNIPYLASETSIQSHTFRLDKPSQDISIPSYPSVLKSDVNNPYLQSYNLLKTNRVTKKHPILNSKKINRPRKTLPIAKKNVIKSKMNSFSKSKLPGTQKQNLLNDRISMSGAKIMMSFLSTKERNLDINGISKGKFHACDGKSDQPSDLGTIFNKNTIKANRMDIPLKTDQESKTENLPSSVKINSMKAEETSTPNEIDYAAALPQLPIEPEYDEDLDHNIRASNGDVNYSSSSNSLFGTSCMTLGASTKVYEPTIFSAPFHSKKQNKSVFADSWWPSNNTIKKETHLRELNSDGDRNFEETSGDLDTNHAKKRRERLDRNTESCHLEKICHCKLHTMKTGLSGEPESLFCTQVTELYPNEVIVCCSICFTWRHARCGGHYSSDGSKLSRSKKDFIPICDFCYKEKKVLSKNKKLEKSIERQRREHLRRTLMVNQVMRQASYSKHSATTKWPLGSVSISHIGGHVRNVQTRHERSEKQWNETTKRLGNGMIYRSKERLKFRQKEFERLMTYIEDAELATDRHNMILFLDRDTQKPQPAGYATQLRNLFDPAEDEEESDEEENNEEEDENDDDENKIENDLNETSSHENDINSIDYENENPTSPQSNLFLDIQKPDENKSNKVRDSQREETNNFVHENGSPNKYEGKKRSHSLASSYDIESDASSHTNATSKSRKAFCERFGCNKKPRFDSLFCSDACGVCALEIDLMRSFEYARQLNPSQLRPDHSQE